MDAETLLAQMEAAEPPPTPGPDAPGATSATTGERAPEAEQVEPAPPETTEPTGAAKPTEPPKPTEQKTAEQIAAETKQASKFAQNQQRLEGGWKQLNERKAALEKTETEYKLREQELTKRQQDLDRKAEELRQPRVKPEQADAWALDWLEQSQAALDEAKRLEDKGDFEASEAKKAEAIILKGKAKDARQYAADLRANPPKPSPTAEQERAEFEGKQKEWGQKASIDFPQCFDKRTAEYAALQALIKTNPDLSNDPQGIYYGARLIAAEQTAARALDWKGKFEAADAKVKKLESKLAIPGGGAATEQSPKSDAEMSEQELETQLRRETAGQRSSYQD
jgi:Predicted membrane protein